MINGLEGIPRSGKSYEATVYHVLASLMAGRKVITNLPLVVEMFAAVDPAFRDLIELRRRVQPVRGVWSAEAVDEEGKGQAFQLFEDGHTEDPESPAALFGEKESERRPVSIFGHVWDFYTTWKHPKTGQGPIFIIDECHVAFPKVGTDKCVVEYFKLHGHFNVDILLMTQNFRDINQPIAGLIAILIKVRKADVLGKKDSYIRKVHAGYRGGVVSTDERKYKPEYFAFYKSHTQGNSVAEAAALDMTPFLVKFNRLKWVVLALGVALTVWAWWPESPKTASGKPEPAWVAAAKVGRDARYAAAARDAAESKPAAPASGAASALLSVSAPDTLQPVGINEFPDPYATKGLHLTGQLTMRGQTVYVIAVSQNGAYVNSITSNDLQAIGYLFKSLTDCAAAVQWREKVRAVTCDSPSITVGYQKTATASPVGSSRQPHEPATATVPPPPLPLVTVGGHGLSSPDSIKSRNEAVRSYAQRKPNP